MADDALDSMYVEFLANYDQLDSAEGEISAIFAGIAEAASSASENISESLTGAAEGFSSISEAASNAGESISAGLVTGDEALAQLGEASAEAGSEVSDALSSVNFSGFQDALNGLTSSVSEAVAQINEQLASVATDTEETESKTKGSTGGIGGSFTGLMGKVGTTIFAFQNMANMAQNLAGGLLSPAANAESMQASFTNLTGSAQTASAELQKLDDFAAHTQFTTLDIDAAGAQLLGFGFKAQDIIPDIQAVGDNLSAVGKGTPAEIQSVIDIFGKMSTQGKITAMDINQLGSHGIKALDDIASGAGLSSTQIQEMIKKGTLPAKDAIDDLTKGIEKNPIYQGGMAKQSGTLSGIMSTLSSDWDVFLSKLVTPALPSLEQGLSNLTTLLTNPSFQQFASLVGTTIVNGVKTLATDIGNLVTTGQNLVNFFKNNQTAMNALVSILITAAGIITGALLPALIMWGIQQAIVAAGVIATAAPFILLGVVVAAIVFGIIEAIQHWGAIVQWLQMIWGHVVQFFQDDIATPMGNLFSNLGSLIQSIWSHVVQFWQDDVSKPFQNTINDIGNAFSGLGTLVHNIGNGIGSAIKGGIDGAISGINSFIGFIDGIQIHIPSIGVGPVHTPSFDWNGLGIPKIPLLATGGFVPPGSMAIAGDEGEELVFGGTAGATVVNHGMSMAMLAQGGQMPTPVIHNHIHIDGKEMTHAVGQQMVSMIRSHGPVGATI